MAGERSKKKTNKIQTQEIHSRSAAVWKGVAQKKRLGQMIGRAALWQASNAAANAGREREGEKVKI
jgi:hypothetical protein